MISGIGNFNPSIRKDINEEGVIARGEIELVDNIFMPPKFIYQGEVVTPHIITISSQQYYIMTIEGFEVGDYVEITYLPHSKVIISIHETISG